MLKENRGVGSKGSLIVDGEKASEDASHLEFGAT